MLYWLLQRFAPLLQRLELYSSGDSRVFLTARIAVASVTAFLAALVLGPSAIRWLGRRFRERVDSASERLNEIQARKNHTPTMGGLFILAAVVISTLLWSDLTNAYVLLALTTVVGFGLLGAADDWIKLSTQRRGLTVKQKFFVQLALGLLVSVPLYLVQQALPYGTELVWPFGNFTLPLGAAFVCWSTLVLVGSSNAVNLTDGLDGLAAGCVVLAGSAFTALSYLAGHRIMAEYLSLPFVPGSGELAVVVGAMVGAMLGFLWFNCYPAEVFMGDTGALPVGALLGLAALVTRQEVLLVIVGGVFVIETLSVILQVLWFKWTGKRLFACSPLHNHFLFKGQHEFKIVVRFWIGSAVLAVVAIASLKIR